jgi:hypothetical protein
MQTWKTLISKRMRGPAVPGAVPPTGASAPAPARGLTGRMVRQYGANYTDGDVERMGQEDGNASLNDTGVWGRNALKVWAIRVLNRGHRVNMHLIGHALRAQLLDVYRRLAPMVERTRKALQDALDAIEDYLMAAVEKEKKRQEIKREGLAFPHWIAHSGLYALVLVGLVLGDWAFIAVAFELFGLSDANFLGIPFTDMTHIAASASVLALVVLAHVAGKNLRAVAHDIDRRRKTTGDDAREALPEPSRVAMIVAAVCLLAALSLLIGVAQIRAGYLAQNGVNAQSLPFFLIQLAVFVAALAIAMAHAHPHGRDWVDLSRREKDAKKAMDKLADLAGENVGMTNALIDEGNALIAQAGHHVGASLEDVLRQAPLYVRRLILSIPEPTENELFPQPLEEPERLGDPKLARFLIGITGIAVIPRLSTELVDKRREEVRETILKLRRPLIDPEVVVGDGAANGVPTAATDVGHSVFGHDGPQEPRGDGAGVASDGVPLQAEDSDTATSTIKVPRTGAATTNGGVKR